MGLNAEPDGGFAYLLEDDISTSHWGRVLVLIALLVCVAACLWHWRRELRDSAIKFSQRPATIHAEQVSYSASPISTSGSEAAGAVPKAQPSTEKPMSENYAQQASQPLPPGNLATRGNAVAEEQRLPQADTAAPEVQTPTANTWPITKSRSDNDESAVATASSDGERPTKESVTVPSGPNAQTTAPNNQGDALEAEGERYLYGTGASANCARAHRDLIAAAGRSSAKAESVLGTMYATGHCVPRDLPLGYRWFLKAVKQEPSNSRFERDLQLLWNQMTPDERQITAHGE